MDFKRGMADAEAGRIVDMEIVMSGAPIQEKIIRGRRPLALNRWNGWKRSLKILMSLCKLAAEAYGEAAVMNSNPSGQSRL